MTIELKQLTARDIPVFEAMMTVFGQAFNEMDVYTRKRPGQDYLHRLLESDTFIALSAMQGETVIGGLTAYELRKFEQERSEIYIYDLAVDEAYRRQGIATALISHMKLIAAKRGACVLIIEADTGPEDQPAIALYNKLGSCEEVLHFNIVVQDQ